VLQQYEPHELMRQVANGRPWDLDRTYGGLRLLHPYRGDSGASGWFEGNADALQQNRAVIAEFGPDVVVVLSADHVYKLDYSAVVADHLDSDATVTMVTTQVPLSAASRYGTVEVDGTGSVAEFAYKPSEPTSDIITTEVFVYDAHGLLETLDSLAGGNDGDGLSDFGDELLPRLVGEGRARAYGLGGYWRDVGTIDAYWESHMDMLAPEPQLVLDDPEWPILTLGIQRPPARLDHPAQVRESWVSPGATVRGTVERAVLGPGVRVEEGAVVRGAVVLHDAVIERGATVERAVVDENARIGEEATVGGEAGALTVVGGEAVVETGAALEAGGRVERRATYRAS
jgi:glucose-1-phosphate adenylyltransferase